MTKPTTTINHPATEPRRVPIEQRRLPAAPLLQAVQSAARRRQQPLEELLGEAEQHRNPWLLQALRHAQISGQVTVLTGEHVCDVLGWHPRMIWGDTYDTTIADTTPHTTTAPAGTPTAWRQGCRCLDCRDANRAAVARSAARQLPGGERSA
jgi:hypothetical protein